MRKANEHGHQGIASEKQRSTIYAINIMSEVDKPQMICRGVILSGRQSCKLGALDKVCLVQTALWLIWPGCIKIRAEVR